MSLATGRRLIQNQWTVLPMPTDIIRRVNQLAWRNPKGLIFSDLSGNPIMAQTDNDTGEMEEDMDDTYDVPHLMPRNNDDDSSNEEDSDNDDSSYSPSEHIMTMSASTNMKIQTSQECMRKNISKNMNKKTLNLKTIIRALIMNTRKNISKNMNKILIMSTKLANMLRLTQKIHKSAVAIC
eukprot:12324535-Ditylum_brightwellii.AAC.1